VTLEKVLGLGQLDTDPGLDSPIATDANDHWLRRCGKWQRQSAVDAQAMRDAGAELIQLYTGLVYHGPRLIQEIAA